MPDDEKVWLAVPGPPPTEPYAKMKKHDLVVHRSKDDCARYGRIGDCRQSGSWLGCSWTIVLADALADSVASPYVLVLCIEAPCYLPLARTLYCRIEKGEWTSRFPSRHAVKGLRRYIRRG